MNGKDIDRIKEYAVGSTLRIFSFNENRADDGGLTASAKKALYFWFRVLANTKEEVDNYLNKKISDCYALEDYEKDLVCYLIYMKE
jgi:hypothetical protein